MSKQEPSGEVPDISVSGSQGVQVGPGNQYNNWAPKPPLDPAAMRDLNPHIAVAQLRELEHRELVNFFARAGDSLRGRLGFPVTEEQPAGADGSGRIQFFENGNVTLWDGEYEVWLRPDL